MPFLSPMVAPLMGMLPMLGGAAATGASAAPALNAAGPLFGGVLAGGSSTAPAAASGAMSGLAPFAKGLAGDMATMGAQHGLKSLMGGGGQEQPRPPVSLPPPTPPSLAPPPPLMPGTQNLPFQGPFTASGREQGDMLGRREMPNLPGTDLESLIQRLMQTKF